MSQPLLPQTPAPSPFRPTQQQAKALDRLHQFMSQSSAYLFLLAGYAGVGKSRCIFQLIEWLQSQQQHIHLLKISGSVLGALASHGIAFVAKEA